MMPLTPTIVRDLIQASDDFGFEMRVRRLLHSIPGSLVEHGGTYVDQNRSIHRQFDLRVHAPSLVHDFYLAVECKNLTADLPIVVSGTKRTGNESFHEVICARAPNSNYNGQFSVNETASKTTIVAPQSVYPINGLVGKSVSRIELKGTGRGNEKSFSLGQDKDAYEGWAQALSSANELCGRASTHPGGRRPAYLYCAVVPILVLPDKSLMVVEYDETGSMISDPETVDGCTLFVNQSVYTGVKQSHFYFNISHLQIYTFSGLKSFVSELCLRDGPYGSNNTEATELFSRWFPGMR